LDAIPPRSILAVFNMDRLNGCRVVSSPPSTLNEANLGERLCGAKPERHPLIVHGPTRFPTTQTCCGVFLEHRSCHHAHVSWCGSITVKITTRVDTAGPVKKSARNEIVCLKKKKPVLFQDDLGTAGKRAAVRSWACFAWRGSSTRRADLRCRRRRLRKPAARVEVGQEKDCARMAMRNGHVTGCNTKAACKCACNNEVTWRGFVGV
jgi:hypothetical protein